MDMSALIQMMQTMAGEDELAKNGLDRAIDRVIRMKDVMDTAKNPTADDKRLYADGNTNLQLNLKENVFKSHIHLPIKSFRDLQKLMMGAGSSSRGSAVQKVCSRSHC